MQCTRLTAQSFLFMRLNPSNSCLSAAYKGIMALLLQGDINRDFMNNTTIDIVNSMLESPDIHHIFPKHIARKWASSANGIIPSLTRPRSFQPPTSSIGGNAPSESIWGQF